MRTMAKDLRLPDLELAAEGSPSMSGGYGYGVLVRRSLFLPVYI